jgi:hypothetical protein
MQDCHRGTRDSGYDSRSHGGMSFVAENHRQRIFPSLAIYLLPEGAGVNRLTMTKITLKIQNTYQACIIKEISGPWLISFSVPNTGKSSTNDRAPTRKANIKVTIEASLVPRRQNTPKQNIVVMGGGGRSAAITLIASKSSALMPSRPP